MRHAGPGYSSPTRNACGRPGPEARHHLPRRAPRRTRRSPPVTGRSSRFVVDPCSRTGVCERRSRAPDPAPVRMRLGHLAPVCSHMTDVPGRPRAKNSRKGTPSAHRRKAEFSGRNDERRAIIAVTTLCNETFIRATTRDDDWHASRAVAVAGGATWALAVLQYVAATLIAASAWTGPHYNWLNNSISNLANTECRTFAVPNGTPGYVCSPLHAVMNGSFVLTGVLVIVGALLLWRIRPSSWLNDTALVLLVIMGLGKVLLGFAP